MVHRAVQERQGGGSSAWTPMAPPGCARLSPALMICPQAHGIPPPSVMLAPLTRPADLTTLARTIAKVTIHLWARVGPAPPEADGRCDHRLMTRSREGLLWPACRVVAMPRGAAARE